MVRGYLETVKFDEEGEYKCKTKIFIIQNEKELKCT